jgi:hypothetical protein
MELSEAKQILKENGYTINSSCEDWYDSKAYNELSNYIINKISAKIEEKCGNEILKKFWSIMENSYYMDSTLIPGQSTMEEIVNISTDKIWNTFIRKLDDNDEILTLNDNYPQSLFQTDKDEVILK